MSIFNFLRRSAAPSPAAPVVHGGPAAEQVAETVQRPVAPGLTVEMKLRGRKGGDQEIGLEAAENRLAELRALYQRGSYSGHPEEMLEDIEFAENAVQRLRDASTA